MAWYKRYRIPFQSFGGTQYMVYIYEQTSGALVTLTGADNPFVTQEDDDNDIFTPIRIQTGYLRVIDQTEDGSLLESIIPSNNTQKLVRLYTGAWNNSFTTFTDGVIKWQGFLCAEAFTQEWDNNIKVLEFPIKSLLGALEDVHLPDAAANYEENIADLIVMAFGELDVEPDSIAVSSQMSNALDDLLKMLVQFLIFFSEETINNEGDSYNQLVGVSFAEALSYVCSLYGLTMRENGTTISLSAYDKQAGRIYTNEWTYADIMNIAAGNAPSGSSGSFMPETAMLPQLTFKGDNNSAGFVQGGKDAKVSLQISDKTFYMDLPQTTETSDAPIELQLYEDGDNDEGVLYVQPHQPRNLREVFTFKEYKRRTLVGDSSYAACLEHSVINGYMANPYYSADTILYVGAFPVRFFHRKENELVTLKNGVYMNTQYFDGAVGAATYAPLYSVTSHLALNATEGWLNIQFLLQELAWIVQGGDTGYAFGDGINKYYYNQDIQTEVHMCLQVGNLFWNGTDWVAGSAPSSEFFFVTKNGRVPDNKTEDMNTDEDNGYFIPITRPLVGHVTLHILNAMAVKRSGSSSTYLTCYTHILSELDIAHILPKSIVASDRNGNVYRKSIINSGFSEGKNIDLNIGTINNNYMAPSFIKINSTDFAEAINYYTANNTISKRPELHLLDRMVEQYNQVRRTFKAQIASGLELLKTRYTYLSRAFFAVDAQHNWRDDTQEVKFIEVS